jgi:DNA polymerase-1
MMPGVAEWIQRQHQLVLERREVKSLYGRVRRFPVLFDRAHVAAMQRQAVNMPIQSSVSDMTLLANLRILRRLRQEGVPVLPWPHFHDGFIIQVGEDHVDRGVAICVEEMHDTGFRTDVPFAIDVSVGPSWAETNEVYRG